MKLNLNELLREIMPNSQSKNTWSLLPTRLEYFKLEIKFSSDKIKCNVCGSSGSVTCCSRKLFLKQDKNLASSLPHVQHFQSMLQ